MCYSNFELVNKYLKTNISPKYIPIPIVEKTFHVRHFENKYVINASYLGRLDLDKYILCIELVRDIIRFNENSDIKIKLFIIGNGSHLEQIKQITKKYEDYFFFKGVLSGSDLDNFLKNNIDLSFAVGTSALETAALGIPTIFMRNPLYSQDTMYKYLWLYNSLGFELSLSLNIQKEKPGEIVNLEVLVDEYLKSNSEIGRKCYQYTINNHSLKVVGNLLFEAVQSTLLKIEDII